SCSRSYPRFSKRFSRPCWEYFAPRLRLTAERFDASGVGSRSIMASAVVIKKAGLFVPARRRRTDARLPAISRDGSRPSNGRLSRRGETITSAEGSNERTTLPIRSTRAWSPARKTRPPGPESFHCLSRFSANRPRGEDEAIALRETILFLLAGADG